MRADIFNKVKTEEGADVTKKFYLNRKVGFLSYSGPLIFRLTSPKDFH